MGHLILSSNPVPTKRGRRLQDSYCGWSGEEGKKCALSVLVGTMGVVGPYLSLGQGYQQKSVLIDRRQGKKKNGTMCRMSGPQRLRPLYSRGGGGGGGKGGESWPYLWVPAQIFSLKKSSRGRVFQGGMRKDSSRRRGGKKGEQKGPLLM